jgi:3-hydroxyisobutyrate dehydrogenase-like beta-hydroxyacid dehydrogenase
LHKDLRLAQEIAQDLDAPVPVITAALLTYTLARSLGLGAEDTTAVVKVWEKALGVEVRRHERPAS